MQMFAGFFFFFLLHQLAKLSKVKKLNATLILEKPFQSPRLLDCAAALSPSLPVNSMFYPSVFYTLKNKRALSSTDSCSAWLHTERLLCKKTSLQQPTTANNSYFGNSSVLGSTIIIIWKQIKLYKYLHGQSNKWKSFLCAWIILMLFFLLWNLAVMYWGELCLIFAVMMHQVVSDIENWKSKIRKHIPNFEILDKHESIEDNKYIWSCYTWGVSLTQLFYWCSTCL